MIDGTDQIIEIQYEEMIIMTNTLGQWLAIVFSSIMIKPTSSRVLSTENTVGKCKLLLVCIVWHTTFMQH